jgi:UPF0755 protein
VSHDDGGDAGWYSARSRSVRDEYAPPEPLAQPPRRSGRHGRPGAPDARPPAAPQPAMPQSGYGASDYGPADYGQPGYGPAAPSAGASHDPYGGRPDPYGPPDPYGASGYGPAAQADPYGPDGYGAGQPAGRGQSGGYAPPPGYGSPEPYGPADPYGPAAGHEPPETYSQPGASGTGPRPAARDSSYGATPYGPADPYSTGPRATSNGSYGTGSGPQGNGTGAYGAAPGSNGTGAYGASPADSGGYGSVDPFGTGPGGSPAPGRSGRHGRPSELSAGGYDSGPYPAGAPGPSPARPGPAASPDPYGPPDPYGSASGYSSGQFPVPGEHTGPLGRSGPQDFSLRRDRPDHTGPLPRAGTPGGLAVPPDRSGPQYQAGAQFQRGTPYRGGSQDGTGPQDRTAPRAWPAAADPWADAAGRTGPQRPVGGSDVFTPSARPLPSTPYDDSLPGRAGLPGGDLFGDGPDPYDGPGALPGLPAAAGPGGRSGSFRWEPPAEPGGESPDEASTALWRNGRPVGPSGYATASFGSGPEDAAPTGRLEADEDLADGPEPWDPRDPRNPRPGGPGPDAEPEEPDWASGERHPGFFSGFGDDDNVDPPKRRRGRWIAPLISVVVILAILGTVGGVLVHIYAARHANYVGAGTGTVQFTVNPGDTATTLAPQLVKIGVIKSTDPFIAAAKQSANADALTPGVFRLHRHMNATLAWNLLVNPSSRIQTEVIVPPGMRAATLLQLLAKDTGKPLSQFQAAYKDPAALGLPSFANGNPEGYFFPDTYDFPPGTTPAQMLHAMVAEFVTQTNSIGLAAAAGKAQFSVEQVITEASLLEAEVDPGDYAKAARTIDNRLNVKMPLQLDSTVLYALHITGFSLTTSQLHVSSPYNTFLHTGLPPGPIDSPGLQAINAVLHPASGNWIYFVTIDPKTGETKFTNSASQFQQWVAQSDKNIANGT